MFKYTLIYKFNFNLKNSNSEINNPLSKKNIIFYIYCLKKINKNFHITITKKNNHNIMLIKSPHLYKYSKHIVMNEGFNLKISLHFDKNKPVSIKNAFKTSNVLMNLQLFQLPQTKLIKSISTFQLDINNSSYFKI